jgi:hypothetical protein
LEVVVADVFARVQREMQDRLKQVEAELEAAEGLIAEKAQIEHALAASPFADATPARARKSPRVSRLPTPKVRAPRGANRAAVHAAVDMMPGASAGAIAAASRFGHAQVYALLRAGIEQGELQAVELAENQVIRPVETAFPPAARSQGSSTPVWPSALSSRLGWSSRRCTGGSRHGRALARSTS